MPPAICYWTVWTTVGSQLDCCCSKSLKTFYESKGHCFEEFEKQGIANYGQAEYVQRRERRRNERLDPLDQPRPFVALVNSQVNAVRYLISKFVYQSSISLPLHWNIGFARIRAYFVTVRLPDKFILRIRIVMVVIIVCDNI